MNALLKRSWRHCVSTSIVLQEFSETFLHPSSTSYWKPLDSCRVLFLFIWAYLECLLLLAFWDPSQGLAHKIQLDRYCCLVVHSVLCLKASLMLAFTRISKRPPGLVIPSSQDFLHGKVAGIRLVHHDLADAFVLETVVKSSSFLYWLLSKPLHN